MTMFWREKPKIIENIVLMYQWERCTHILYTPFPLLYDYDLEWKTENYRKHCSPLAMGTVYTYSVYTVPRYYCKYGYHVLMGTVYKHSVYTVPVTI